MKPGNMKAIFTTLVMLTLAHMMSATGNSLLSEDVYNKYCTAPLYQRLECTENRTENDALNQHDCEQRGCCWDDSATQGGWLDNYAPYCFRPTAFKTSLSAKVYKYFCNMTVEEKDERMCTGGPYYDPDTCEAKGCCWHNDYKNVTKCYRPYSAQAQFPKECIVNPGIRSSDNMDEDLCHKLDGCWDYEKKLIIRNFPKKTFEDFDSLCYTKNKYTTYKSGNCQIDTGMNFTSCNPNATTQAECEATVVGKAKPCCWRNTQYNGVRCYYNYYYRTELLETGEEDPDPRSICTIPVEDRVPLVAYIDPTNRTYTVKNDKLYYTLTTAAKCRKAGGCYAVIDFWDTDPLSFNKYCYRPTDYKETADRAECQFNVTAESKPCTSKNIVTKSECERIGCCFYMTRTNINNFCYASLTQMS